MKTTGPFIFNSISTAFETQWDFKSALCVYKRTSRLVLLSLSSFYLFLLHPLVHKGISIWNVAESTTKNIIFWCFKWRVYNYQILFKVLSAVERMVLNNRQSFKRLNDAATLMKQDKNLQALMYMSYTRWRNGVDLYFTFRRVSLERGRVYVSWLIQCFLYFYKYTL